MPSDLLQRTAQQVLDVFNALPRPEELKNVAEWKIIDSGPDDGKDGAIRDIYYAWIGAVVDDVRRFYSPQDPMWRHFAVGIRWSGDELDSDLEYAVGCKITRAVLCFCDSAQEYRPGGALPEPTVGVPLLDRGPSHPEFEHLYRELIMTVGNCFKGETRHQTALRYIQQAERSNNQTDTVKAC